MNRVATWSNVGTDVTANRVADILKQSNLDYTVTTENMVSTSGLIVPNKKLTVANYADGTRKALGVVGSNYTICQNDEAFNFVDNVIDNGVNIVKAGETQSGLVYMIGQLPTINVLGDDIQHHIIFQNSHNGAYTLAAAICALRIVCQNQFARTFKNLENNINIHHTVSLPSRLEMSGDIMRQALVYAQNFKAEAERQAGKRLTTEMVNKIFDEYIRRARGMYEKKMEDISQRVLTGYEEDMAFIQNAYNAEDNQNFKNTLWGVTNAFTDYLTHRDVKKTANANETNFVKVTLGKETQKFVDIANAIAA